jgi:hypothetical protein
MRRSASLAPDSVSSFARVFRASGALERSAELWFAQLMWHQKIDESPTTEQ